MTQDEPIMHGSTDASDESKIAGIVEQVRVDMQLPRSETTEMMLRERFDASGLQVSEDDLALWAADIDDGPAAG
ncbi:hypothetical protein [Leifsonia sp. LS-T14]|uniref:hypothetical protein n=1 Tax=unclassified Leifsonia TaxID=2663824 RepID=UPI0035A6338C